MNTIKTICVASLLALPHSGTAATWLAVYGDKQVAVEMDRDSAIHKGQMVKVWTRWYHAKTTHEKGIHPYQSAKKLYSVDCAERRFSLLQAIYYSDRGTSVIVDSLTAPESRRYIDVAPETIGESVLMTACELKRNSRARS